MQELHVSLIINKTMLGPAYDYLRATKPFAGWRLPPADEVFFGLIPHKDRYAHYYTRANGQHAIEMSTTNVERHVTLLRKMAHEMTHLYQHKAGLTTRTVHNTGFWRLADRICKVHVEFERREF